MKLLYIFVSVLLMGAVSFVQASSEGVEKMLNVGPIILEVSVTIDKKEIKFILFGAMHTVNFYDLPKSAQNILLSANNFITEQHKLSDQELHDPYYSMGLATKDKQTWLNKLDPALQAKIKQKIEQIQEWDDSAFYIDPKEFTLCGASLANYGSGQCRGVDDILMQHFEKNGRIFGLYLS